MKNLFPLVFLILVTSKLFAQVPARLTVQGRVTDTLSTALPGSTVMLLSTKDSSLVSFARSVENGAFSIKNVKPGSYILKLSYVGFLPLNRSVTLTDGPIVDLGPIKLKPIAKELFEVVIKTARAPLTVKGDTVEYNASSFKVPPGSTVEDLLKKLPGVLVDQDGNIKAQGQDVKRVTVDGKSFFGNDPKLATKNLSAEAISKVQVFSGQSEQSKITGVSDGKKEKTMNLELKEGFKKGGFGKLTAGGGPATNADIRGETKGNYNKFNDKQQFSIIGLANNTNQSGLSFDDYQDFRGSNSFNWNDDADFGFSSGNRYISFGDDGDDNLNIPINGGRGRGFSNNVAAGANYNYDTKKTKFSGSYYYNQSRVELDALRSRQNFLENGSFRTNENSNQINFTGSHRVSLRFEKTLDSLNSIILLSNSRLNSASATLNSMQQLYRNNGIGTPDELSTRTNTANGSRTNGFGMANTLIYRLKFKKKGRSFAASATWQLNSSDGSATQKSQTDFYQATTVNEYLRNINQLNTTNSHRNEYKSSLIYVEPFAKKFFWESFYNFSLRYDEVDRDVNDISVFDSSLQGRRNDTLSRYYKNNYLFNRLGSGVRYSFKGLNLSAGGAFQHFTLDGHYASDQTSPTLNTINRTFTTVVPNLSLNYDLKNNRYLYGGYDVSVQMPSSRDLQPVVNLTNPLFITEGNPNLLPAIQHNLNTGFSIFNPGNFTNFFANIFYNYNVNQIVYAQSIDPQTLVTRTRPVNLTGGQSVGSYMSYGFPLKKTKANLNLNANINIGENLTPINDVINHTNNTTYNIRARLDLTPSDRFTFYANADWGVGNTRYSVNTGQNQQILNFVYSGEANVQGPAGLYLNTSLNYRIYKNDRFGFDQKVPIWNASLYKQLGKEKKAEVRITAYDILNRNIAVSQSAGQNYVSEERIRSLARYFLLSFTYNMRGVQSQMRKKGYF